MRKRYENLDGVTTDKTFRDFLKWRRDRRHKLKQDTYEIEQEPHPLVSYLQKNREDTTITWVGHSTFLIQMNGLSILTDPEWAKRMGLEKRLTPPGLPLDELPNIDVVLISHSHYDHLHYGTLKRLNGDFQLLVPIGLKRKMEAKGFSRVAELDWWEHYRMGDILFHFVPAQHWSKRTLNDTNTSLWGGFVIEGEQTVYFAGDSGYFRGFREIGQRYEIDYALMPIGAYEPEWLLSVQHVNPEQAVRAYLDVGAKYFIPMHYGTFRLGDETPQEALARLRAEWNRLRLDPAGLYILKIGSTIVWSPSKSESTIYPYTK
ncbi:membrane protein [Collibacillus ludicampi]|uniref:Membrane protein n=1 Tax=Collibacillus ludicampi TaxID=2771369 RepID=A0AAV4LG13_9BACL|nr:MBL fold metallo-hydrolase [Collibacillus ludicampi]GIM46407.1 membrane protein [Collibacillus ludicampi]